MSILKKKKVVLNMTSVVLKLCIISIFLWYSRKIKL